MRKQLLFIVCAVLCVAATSCQKDEVYYSCDPGINSLIKQNLNNIATMSSADWQMLDDFEYQRGVYVAFSQDQRISLWVDKFTQMLELDWTDLEKTYIIELSDFVKQNSTLFSGEAEMADEKIIEIYKLIEYAQETLEWNQEMIYSVYMTPELINKDKTIPVKESSINVVKTRSESGELIKTCNCNTANTVFANCVYGNCYIVNIGCGSLWLWPCNGVLLLWV